MTRSSTARLFVATLILLCLLLLWDASGLDLPLARLAATPEGFSWRDKRMFILLMHEVPRLLSWVLLVGLFVAIRWPVGFLRRLDVPARLQLAVSVLAAVLAVSLLKNASRTSCPWDLAEFGGTAHYVSHWAWRVRDGGPGHCFPAGHASAAFAYLAGWFVLQRSAPLVARRWLWSIVVVGLLLGIGQQWRGAHYMSHTLWTAWVCWTVGLLVDVAAQALRRRLIVPVTEPAVVGKP